MVMYRYDKQKQRLVECKPSDLTYHRDVGAGALNRGNQYPYVSDALPSSLPGVSKTTRNGRRKVVVNSAREEREIAARFGYEKDGAAIEDLPDRLPHPNPMPDGPLDDERLAEWDDYGD